MNTADATTPLRSDAKGRETLPRYLPVHTNTSFNFTKLGLRLSYLLVVDQYGLFNGQYQYQECRVTDGRFNVNRPKYMRKANEIHTTLLKVLMNTYTVEKKVVSTQK